MFRFNFIGTILLVAVFFCSEKCSAKLPATLIHHGYTLSAASNERSRYWADYAYKHLVTRTRLQSIVQLQTDQQAVKHLDGILNIQIQVSENLNYQYCVQTKGQALYLSAKNDKIAIWLVYQLIENIAESDSRFVASDLPPSTIDLSQNRCANFDFDYREPFFPYNLQPNFAAILGTNSVDMDWGLWGHNIKKNLRDTANENLYALVDGRRVHSQFCFSSPVLLQQLSQFILNDFGKGLKEPYNFMILPSDNGLVCMDHGCKSLGNTTQNATPAVADLIRKLANQFPNHRFFTTAYRTTLNPPLSALPENAGVFISTMDLPKGVKLSQNQPATENFLKLLTSWKQVCNHVFIWDYAANFDDYLSPIPVLFGLQKQLQFFKGQKIKGVFLEGSDYDYTPFGDLKTYVSAALMMNTNADIDSLCYHFFRIKYPTSCQLLYAYYISIEKEFFEKGKPYDLYGGTQEALIKYLNTVEFIKFYRQLPEMISQSKGQEKTELKKLYTALSFTRLQIAYFNGSGKNGYASLKDKTMHIKPEIATWLANLEAFSNYKDMKQYREEDGSLVEYCRFWKTLLSQQFYTNQLIGTRLNEVSKGNSSVEDITLLNDGKPGFTQDYHQGWFITKNNTYLNIPVNQLQGLKLLTMNFLIDQRHGFYPPDSIELFIDGKLTKTIRAQELQNEEYEAKWQFGLRLEHNHHINLKFYLKQAVQSKLACDEIQITNA